MHYELCIMHCLLAPFGRVLVPFLQYVQVAFAEGSVGFRLLYHCAKIGQSRQGNIGLMEDALGGCHLIIEDSYNPFYGATIVAQGFDYFFHIIARIHLILNDYHFLSWPEVPLFGFPVRDP